jgi:uncharacterized membrane protein YhfC
MSAILCLACSHLLVGFVCYSIGRIIWYRRGLDDAWEDYGGVSFHG